MTERKPAAGLVDTTLDQAKIALDKLRRYAAEHSTDINATIDKMGDFVNKQTGQKYRTQVGKVQSFARTQVNKLDRPSSPDLSEAKRAFGVDEDAAPSTRGATAWRQPPTGFGDATTSSPKNAAAGGSTLGATVSESLKDAAAKARQFASDHVDDLHTAVDKVGRFVDEKTDGKYAAKIGKVQAQTKKQVNKLRTDDVDKTLRTPDGDLVDPPA